MLNPEELLDFLDELRQRGFNIGAEQFVAAQDLLLALAGHGKLPVDPRRLRTYLAPIVCASPQEQEAFYREFDQTFAPTAPLPVDAPSPGAAPELEEDQPTDEAWQGLMQRLRPWWWIAGAAAISVLLIASIVYFNPPPDLEPPPQRLHGQVLNDQGLPVHETTVSFLGKTTYSDSAGHFSFVHPQRDSLAELSVQHPEYVSWQTRINLPQLPQLSELSSMFA